MFRIPLFVYYFVVIVLVFKVPQTSIDLSVIVCVWKDVQAEVKQSLSH